MPKTVVILVVEDNADDADLLARAFAASAESVRLDFVEDTKQAEDYLRREGVYAHRSKEPAPDMMLVDLGLGFTSGLDLLAWVRQQPGLKGMCLGVVSGLKRESDAQRACELGAHFFALKPITRKEVADIVQRASWWVGEQESRDGGRGQFSGE